MAKKTPPTFDHVKTIGILGAGLAGLTAAKVFLESKERKYDIVIFEAEPYLGGVWSHSYPSLCVQTVRDWFGWSFRELSPKLGDWPAAGSVAAEFNKFADDYNIRPLIRFDSRVLKLHRGKDNGTTARGYTVDVQDTKTDEVKQFNFDFFILANGRYSKKRVPDLPGKDEYTGEILHSSEYRDWKQLNGKSVLVVGGGKSGLEISTEVAEHNQPVVLAARSVYYTPPRKILGFLNHRFLIYMPALKYCPSHYKYFNFMSLGEKLVYSATRWAWFVVAWFLQLIMTWQFQLKKLGIAPHNNFYKYYGSFDIATPGFFENLAAKKIDLRQSPVERFIGGKKLRLKSGEEISADSVVFCTGYTHDHSFMPDDVQKLKEEEGGLYLYRFMLHPSLLDVGFVCQADPFSSTLCAELTSRWLLGVIEGKVPYPSVEEMQARMKLDREEILKIDDEGSPLAIHPFEYFFYKEVLLDLGLIKPPKGGDWLLEYFSPCWARDFGSAFKSDGKKENNSNFKYNLGLIALFTFVSLVMGKLLYKHFE